MPAKVLKISSAAAKPKEVTINILEPIGETWWGDGLSSKTFAEHLKAADGASRIIVNMDSIGGSVFDGTAIYNMLRIHPAEVHVNILGGALSIASIVALAGDKIAMAHNGWFMIHDPMGIAIGNSRAMREEADLLDKVKGNLVDTYALRSKTPKDEIASMMEEESWLTAEEAMEHGWVDELLEKEAVVNAGYDFSRFKHPPQSLLAASGKRSGLAGQIAAINITAQQLKMLRGKGSAA